MRDHPQALSAGSGSLASRPPDYPFAAHWFDNRGVRQHYLDEGQGPPVLMVHGNPSWSYYWRHLVLALRDDYRCVVPDHIGMGLSDRPAPALYPYSVLRRADDLERLLDHLVAHREAPREGWTLVLHDWGGPIGLSWARRHPGLVTRLIVLNTFAFPWPSDYRLPWFLRIIRSRPWVASLVDHTNLFTRTAARLGTTRGFPRGVREAYLAPYARRADRRAIVRFIQDIPLSTSDLSWELIGHSDENALAGMPVFIGWGDRDPVFTDTMFRDWSRRFPRAEIHRYPEAGHYVLEDAQEDLIPRIRNFLDSTGPGPGSRAPSQERT